MTRFTTIAVAALCVPCLSAVPLAALAQSNAGAGASGGPGTAGGPATSRSQIGIQSPAGVVNPNANGTGLGTASPGSTDTLLNQRGTSDANAGAGRAATRCGQASPGTTSRTPAANNEAAAALAQSSGSTAAQLTDPTDTTGSVGTNCSTQP